MSKHTNGKATPADVTKEIVREGKELNATPDQVDYAQNRAQEHLAAGETPDEVIAEAKASEERYIEEQGGAES